MNVGTALKLGLGGFVGLLALSAVGGSFYTIDERERGIVLRNGALVDVSEPGLDWKLPFITTVREISLETFKTQFKDLAAYSRDQQPADFDVSVNWRIDPSKIEEVYRTYRDAEGLQSRLVIPRVNDATKSVFGTYNASTVIQDRGRFGTEVQMMVKQALEGTTVIVESVQVENIDFSDAYEKSVEQRMLAEVEVQRIKQNAERERVTAEITVTRAKAEADSKLALAKAEADAIKLRGSAEADAIKARGAALRDNPSLIELVQAERWDGKLPSTMLPGSALPMVSIGAAGTTGGIGGTPR